MHGLAHGRGPRAALRHPVFLGALALLLVNDHWLKHAGLVSGEITGKLSDLAGLIVAPVVLGALLDLRSRAARALAFGAIAAAFAALELSAAAAASWDALLGAIGIPSRSWADPTDLVGLAMLPIAWWLVSPPAEREPSRGGALGQTALALGLFACLATSQVPPAQSRWITGGWIHNATGEAIDVRLRWYEGALSCNVLDEADLGAAAAPDAFGEGVTFRLEAGDTLPIEPGDARAALGTDGGVPGTGETPPRNECDLVRVSIDGLDDTIVFFEQLDEASIPTNIEASADPTTIPANGIRVVDRDADTVALEVPSAYRTSPAIDRAPAPAASCEGARGEALAHSDLAELEGSTWTITSRGLLLDGCTQLELERASGEVRGTFFCVPADFLPFDVGDEISVTDAGTETMAVIEDAAGRSMVIARGASAVSSYGLSITAREIDVACGERLACDAYVSPVRVSTGEVGVAFDFDAPGGRAGRGLVARAEHVLAAPVGCDAGRSAPGTQIDVVVVIDAAAPPPGGP